MKPRSLAALPFLLLAAAPVRSEVVDAGSSPVIRGVGLRMTVQCNRARVTVEGSDHQIVMRGTCERVAIHGTNNHVAIEEVGSLSVLGSGHDVAWVRGLDGKAPRMIQSGSGHQVRQISLEEFAAIPSP